MHNYMHFTTEKAKITMKPSTLRLVPISHDEEIMKKYSRSMSPIYQPETTHRNSNEEPKKSIIRKPLPKFRVVPSSTMTKPWSHHTKKQT